MLAILPAFPLTFMKRVIIMKRKFSFSMLVVFMALLCFPFSALADSVAEPLDFTLSKTESCGNGWSWDAASRTLTLSGLSIDVARWATRSSPYALKVPDGTTIVLADGSVNTLVVSAESSGAYSTYGINALGALCITGGGTLNVVISGSSCGSSFGIYAMGDVTIDGGAEVSTTGGDVKKGRSLCSAGIHTSEGLTVNGASLTASGSAGEDMANSYGIYASGRIVFENSSVIASGGWASGESCGIKYAEGVSIYSGEITSVSYCGNCLFSISDTDENSNIDEESLPGEVIVYGGSFNASVAQYAADTLNFEVDRGDGRFAYFETADEALKYAGSASGVTITGVGASAGLKSCAVSISCSSSKAGFTRIVPEGFAFTLPDSPPRSGCIFLGWQCGNATYSAHETVAIRGDSVFSPVWGSLPCLTMPESGSEFESDAPVMEAVEYADVSQDDWYAEAVEFVSANGLMHGVGSGCFAPEAELSRAMFWTVLARAEGVGTDSGCIWYADAQEWAAAAGVSDGEKPEASITREQLVTMLYRLYGEAGQSGELEEIPDAGNVSGWAREAMAWAVGLGFIEGDETGAINPSDTATRAQAAVILMRLAQVQAF